MTAARDQVVVVELQENEKVPAVVEGNEVVVRLVPVVEESVTKGFVRMCLLIVQIGLIYGLVKGKFESTLWTLRGLLFQTILLYALLRSTRGAPAAQNGALYNFLSVVGSGCQIYMGVKLFFLLLK